jgi:hypothetical protein
MSRLPIEGRGYPVPFFMSYFGGNPDFRVTNRDKIISAALNG